VPGVGAALSRSTRSSRAPGPADLHVGAAAMPDSGKTRAVAEGLRRPGSRLRSPAAVMRDRDLRTRARRHRPRSLRYANAHRPARESAGKVRPCRRTSGVVPPPKADRASKAARGSWPAVTFHVYGPSTWPPPVREVGGVVSGGQGKRRGTYFATSGAELIPVSGDAQVCSPAGRKAAGCAEARPDHPATCAAPAERRRVLAAHDGRRRRAGSLVPENVKTAPASPLGPPRVLWPGRRFVCRRRRDRRGTLGVGAKAGVMDDSTMWKRRLFELRRRDARVRGPRRTALPLPRPGRRAWRSSGTDPTF